MASRLLTFSGWLIPKLIYFLKTVNDATKAVNTITSCTKDQYNLLFGLRGQIKKLEEVLPKFQAIMEAVDRCPIKDEDSKLKEWVWQLRDAVDEAENFLDEMDYYQLEEEICGNQSKVSDAASRLETFIKRLNQHNSTSLKRLEKILKKLDKVAANVGDFFMLVETLTHQQPSVVTSSRETGSCLTIQTRVFGRDNEKEDVIKKLLNFNPTSRKNYSILFIHGVGGVGKTTLAQFVYHDKRIEQHFDKRMWVCVSNNANLISLTQKIYESALGEKTNLDNLHLLQEKLSKKLESQRFLLVLDDVWDDIDKIGLEKLLAPLRSGERGSMILLTSRITSVGGKMLGKVEPVLLKGLDERDYWEFFKECAFLDEDPEDYKMLQDIGRRTASRLRGSPLAAKTVGGILSANLDVQHWENILNSEIWELKQDENSIMPALKLSYQYLPSHLKPCFSFCSIFPQDYEFDKVQLIYMWMALGLLQKHINENRRLEDTGDEYLNDLVRKSFFDCRTDNERTYYVMHDLLHELATSVSRGECLSIEESSRPIHIPTSLHHLSIHTSVAPSTIDQITKLKNLRTLLILERNYTITLEVLKGLTTLRILASPTLEFTDGCISNLKHLRYLRNNYYCTSHVPESVNKLYHLQFLYYGNKSVRSYKLCPPDPINNLINLRHLSTPNSVRGNVYGIGKLTSLQILEGFNVRANGNNISELNNLRELRELGIQNLQEVARVEEVIKADLKVKEHLRKLMLEWAYQVEEQRSNVNPEVDEKVLDALQPHSNLKNLQINYYLGRRSAHWMTLRSLSNIQSITLSYCKGWADLPPLGELPYLEFLQLSSMDLVKRIGKKPKVGFFPSLRELHIERLPALENLCGAAHTIQWFPCLRRLRIYRCPKLKMFANLPCKLRDVHIEYVNWTALPALSQGRNSNSLSMSSSLPPSSLSSLKIGHCEGLVSLAESFLMHPELFTSLDNLSVSKCENLTHLPTGQFEKFASLKELRIKCCPKLQGDSTSKSFLPSSLQSLAVKDCAILDPLPKAPKDLNFLSKVELKRCPKIRSLPSAEVLREWKALKELSIVECSELESLGGLQALSSLNYLKVDMCPKLVAAVSSPPMLAESTTSFPDQLQVGRKRKASQLSTAEASSSAPTLPVEDSSYSSSSPSSSSSLILNKLEIDDLSLLCTVPLKSISAQKVYIERCGEVQTSALEEWMFSNRTLLQLLKITRVSSRQFPLVFLQSFSVLKTLKVIECFKLQSLPKLPPSLKKLVLGNCPPELEESCLKDSGPDWAQDSTHPSHKNRQLHQREISNSYSSRTQNNAEAKGLFF